MVESVEDWINLALKSKDLENKLAYCSKYLELNPNDVDVWHYKIYILHDLERKKEVIDYIEKMSKFIDSSSYIAGILRLFSERDYTGSIKFFDEVLKDQPKDARALFHKGIALVNLKRGEEATRYIDKAIELNLNRIYEAEAWFEKGVAMTTLEKSEEAMITYSNKALDIDPGHYGAQILKGTVLLKMRKNREALICYNDALEILSPYPNTKAYDMAKRGKEKAEQLLKTPCFIATAAYGTPFATEIQVLRDWRDYSLRNSNSGRVFIKAYYLVSPTIAKFIEDKELFKVITRKLLKPIINYLSQRQNIQ